MAAVWTEERRERVAILWDKGLSARQIADQLGNVTKNAVIGIVHRAGLSRDTEHRTTKPRTRRKYETLAPQKVKAEVGPRPNLTEPEAKHISLLELNGVTCKFPFGDGPFTFCGQMTWNAGPYCEYHKVLAYSRSP